MRYTLLPLALFLFTPTLTAGGPPYYPPPRVIVHPTPVVLVPYLTHHVPPGGVMPPPVGTPALPPVPWMYRRSHSAHWRYRGITQGGQFRPLVIWGSNRAYYLYNGEPYYFLKMGRMAIRP